MNKQTDDDFDFNKRLNEVRLYLESFKETIKNNPNINVDITYIDNAHLIITTLHFELVDKIKAFHNDNTKLYYNKVASSMELCTLCIAPIIYENPKERKILNALLAWTIGNSFLLGCYYDYFPFNTNNEVTNQFIEDLKDKHIEWLEYVRIKNIYETSVICNSLYWHSMYIFYQIQRDISMPRGN